MRIVLAGMLLVLATPLAAQEAQSDYEAAVAARLAGDNADAVRLLDRWIAAHPQDSDALVQRGYALPLVLSPTSTGKSVLTAWARAIVRYLLNQNRITDARTDPVARDYQDALKMLGLLAQGKYSLGAGDPEAAGSAASGATDVRFAAAAPTFGRGQLTSFR